MGCGELQDDNAPRAFAFNCANSGVLGPHYEQLSVSQGYRAMPTLPTSVHRPASIRQGSRSDEQCLLFAKGAMEHLINKLDCLVTVAI